MLVKCKGAPINKQVLDQFDLNLLQAKWQKESTFSALW